MTTRSRQERPTSTITDYAAERGIDASAMAALIDADPEPVTPVGDDPQGRTIPTGNRLGSAAISDAIYPLAYLDLVAGGIGDDLDDEA